VKVRPNGPSTGAEVIVVPAAARASWEPADAISRNTTTARFTRDKVRVVEDSEPLVQL
jgi:hypothetical protein